MDYSVEFVDYLTNALDYAPNTIETYGKSIQDFAKTTGVTDPGVVTVRTVDSYMLRKGLDGLSASTRRTRLHALRSFFRFLRTRGYITHDPCQAVKAPIVKSKPIMTLSEREVVAMIWKLAQPLPPPRGPKEPETFFRARTKYLDAIWARDTAMLALTYSLALRSEEVGMLRLDAYQTDNRGIPWIHVLGKWAKVPTRMRIDALTAQALDGWLLLRAATGTKNAFLFPPFGGGVAGKDESGVGLTPFSVATILRARCKRAGIDPKNRRISPHILRYSRATHMYAKKIGVLEIQRHLRHSSVTTTIRYIRLGMSGALDKQAAASLPWNDFANPPGLEDSGLSPHSL